MNAHLTLVQPVAPSLANLHLSGGEWRSELCRLIEQTVSIRRRGEERPSLADELARLDALQQHAERRGRGFVQVVAPYAEELACWLWQLALTVAAAGLPDTARGLLGALPGVPANAPARVCQLEALIALAAVPAPRRRAA